MDRSGVPVYLPRLNSAARVETMRPLAPIPEVHRADPETLHQVYCDLLAGLSLSASHRDALRRRGLSDDEIDRRGYRSLLISGRAKLAAGLRERFGAIALRVPGFVVRQGRSGSYLTLVGAAGLLVPVRDTQGRIVALLSRRDDTGDRGNKYTYLSSARHGGSGSGAPVHVRLGVTNPCGICRLTEGVLKADVAFALSSLPTIGAAGLAWKACPDHLSELGVRIVRLAFDADSVRNPHVARALADCAEGLVAAGYAMELERWDAADGTGIDDVLAAGRTLEVLVGDAALAAVRDILATAAGPEPAQPRVLDRLRQMLEAGGAEALFRDATLLHDLARLRVDDPSEFAMCRAAAATAKISLRDLDRSLAPLIHELRQQRSPPNAVADYHIEGGRIVRLQQTRDGPVIVPLAKFRTRIVEQIVLDDGAEGTLTFAVQGELCDGTPLPSATVLAKDFVAMRWPVAIWGTRAVILAGASTADHLRAAIQLLSGDVPRRTVYSHTGWRCIEVQQVFLDAAGAIGRDGRVFGIETSLSSNLAHFILPNLPSGDALKKAVQASLRLRQVAKPRISYSLLATTYRAVLDLSDFSTFVVGPTHEGKSELAARQQQHLGPAMDARNLPANWSSTANSLEGLAHQAQHTLLVMDDFAPGGGSFDVAKHHREADRILRAQGNRSGRLRMRADGSLRPEKYPRGLILATGEDVPRGQSLRGRTLILEVGPGDVDWKLMTQAQQDGAAGLFAQAMVGFILWLAKRGGGAQGIAGSRREVARAGDPEGHAPEDALHRCQPLRCLGTVA